MQASTHNRTGKRTLSVYAFLFSAVCLVVGAGTYGKPQGVGLRGQPPIALPLQIQSDHSLWQVDLRALGFPSGDSELQSRRALEEFNTVDFLSDSIVATTFVTQQSVPGAQRRDDPNRVRPYVLHAAFLNAANGKALDTLEWPVDEPNAGIFPVNGGASCFSQVTTSFSTPRNGSRLRKSLCLNCRPRTQVTLASRNRRATKQWCCDIKRASR